MLGNLGVSRPPCYFVALKSNKYEVEDKRSMGLEVLDLDVSDPAKAEEVPRFLDLLLSKVSGTTLVAPGKPATKTIAPSPDLLSSRLGTGLSLQRNEKHVDAVHHYTKIYRQDLLDYSTGNFVSIRRLCGYNASDRLSAFLPYSESSEQKLPFSDTDLVALDFASGDDLVVEPFHDPDDMAFTHAFKIYFPSPLAPGAAFDIASLVSG